MYLNPNNSITLEGRLSSDPTVDFLPNSGTTKCKFNLAVDRVLTKQQKDNGSQSVDFIPCEALGKTAEFISNYFKKGSAIKLLGAISTYSYDAKDGTKRYGYNVSVNAAAFTVSSPINNQPNNQTNSQLNNQMNNTNNNFDYTPVNYSEDIPF